LGAFAAACLTGYDDHLVFFDGFYDVIAMGGDGKGFRISDPGVLCLSPCPFLKRRLQSLFQSGELAGKGLGSMPFLKDVLQAPGKTGSILQQGER
jgi:hypothetical protein